MDEFKYVEYETADSVAAITLARPEKANAQNERMLDETGHGNAISVSGYPILMQLDEMKRNLEKQ